MYLTNYTRHDMAFVVDLFGGFSAKPFTWCQTYLAILPKHIGSKIVL